MKICVYAISKNEAGFVDRFIESARDADLILIADTGSTDDTCSLVRRHQLLPAMPMFPRAPRDDFTADEMTAYAAAHRRDCTDPIINRQQVVLHEICITPWRFDHARNAALALIPRDVDVCVSLDLDEVLEPGWRQEIERVWTEGTTRLRYGFDWGCGIAFQYEKIHARHGYHWHHPVHEYPVPDARITEVYAQTDRLLVRHLPDPTKSRGQYMPLLELAVREDPHCPRNAFYHARELTFHARWDEAVQALEAYLARPDATWPNERCYAMRLLGQANEELGRDPLPWLRRACAEAPGTREPWAALAMACYRRSLWAECFAAATNGLAIRDKQMVYTMDPAVWGPQLHDLAAIAAHHLGMPKVAIEQGQMAAQLAPDDQRLQDNLEYYLRPWTADSRA